jgi:mono/diheme cytochrome c family protein
VRRPTARLLAGALLLSACDQPSPEVDRVTNGDAARGRALIAEIGCGACHAIPGISGAHGNVGPPLDAVGTRSFIGGVVPNRPDNLIRWVREAPALAPDTAMPSLPLDEVEARHVAAYLYRLR